MSVYRSVVIGHSVMQVDNPVIVVHAPKLELFML